MQPDVWGNTERIQMKGYNMRRHRPKCSVACQADTGVITDVPPAGFEMRPCSWHPGVTAEAASLTFVLLLPLSSLSEYTSLQQEGEKGAGYK